MKSKEIKKTVVDEVSERIDQILEERAAKLSEIDEQIRKAEADKMQYEKAMDAAVKATDLRAYKKAQEGKSNAEMTAEMYRKHHDQLKKTAYVTDADSENTIESILEYESERTAEYETRARAIINELQNVTDAYRADIKESESVINRWTHDIHKNYISYTGWTYDGSDRSPEPIPVHPVPYEGCSLSRSHVDTFRKLSREL